MVIQQTTKAPRTKSVNGTGYGVHEDLSAATQSFIADAWQAVDFTGLTLNEALSKLPVNSQSGFIDKVTGAFLFPALGDAYSLKFDAKTTTVTGTSVTFGYGYDLATIVQEHKTIIPELTAERWSVEKNVIITDNTTPLKLFLKFSENVDLSEIKIIVTKNQENV